MLGRILPAGSAFRMMPLDLPPGYIVDQQTHRWLAAGCVENLRPLLGEVKGRKG
jgi:hypothetical protein